MKIAFHIKDIIIGKKQKDLIEKKLRGLKKYVPGEPVNVDIYLKDETSLEKGGVDQAVEIAVTFGKEKLFVREVDDKMLRAFAYAHKSIERQLVRDHNKKVEKTRKRGSWKIWETFGSWSKKEDQDEK
ncbi:MAG: HPF/RaiA family ribosome-associated protein [Candidatus Berkelbacteria bacterium]